MGLSFVLGYGEGRKVASSGIVFSCPNTVLEPQKITSQVLGVQSDSSTEVARVDVSSATTEKGGAYMGSKNGTKYYTPGCPGTKRIKPENYVWFQSVEDATLQGYTKGSC
jgi:hypothetical protein